MSEEHTAADQKNTKSKNWFMRHKVLTAIIALIVIVAATSSGSKKEPSSSTAPAGNTPAANTETKETPKAEEKPAERKATGTAVTLGAGTFTGGQDVAEGLYDVTAPGGQSGNLIVNEGAKTNEILGAAGGFGVSKVRVSVSKSDVIKISGLNQVTFTPVSAPFVTNHATATLYSGEFKVGEDIGAGKYVATTVAGDTGNLIINEGAKTNEVLGSAGGFGVEKVTVTLSKGDRIKISGLESVTFTAQ